MIAGQTINLRAIEDDDAVVFHAWFNDPEVTRFLGVPFPALSMAQERAFIQSTHDNQSRRSYAIVLKDGTLIGNCELRMFDWTARSCELGIVIGTKQHWGQGYGGEALNLLLTIAFDGLNLHKVWLTCAPYNERGLRAYRRTGFREDGRLRDNRFLDGRYHDTVMMSILEAEWRALRAADAQ
jgi:RimJ/RimL family protein N-acetyltransferase